MTGRRQHHERSGERDADRTGSNDRIDPWEALGPDDPTPPSRSTDEFWGDLPDWSATASTSRRSGRRRIGGSHDEPVDPTPIGAPRPTERRTGIVEGLRGAWDGLLGGGADTTREHRRIDVTPVVSPSPIDHWDDDWGDIDDWSDLDAAVAAHAPTDDRADIDDPTVARPVDSRRGNVDADHPVAEIERGWIAEADASPRRRPGIDPLLARLGAVVIVACLVVPLLIAATRSSDLADRTAGAIASDPVTASELAADDQVTSPPTSAATERSIEPLDPASLPPAVPVNPEPVSGSSESASDRSAEQVAASDAQEESVGSTSSSTASTDAPEARSEQSSGTIAAVDEPADADNPAARVDPPVCPISYTVVEGDFWIRLADAAEVALRDLLEINNATVDTPLFAGSEICLPAGATTPAPPTTTPTTTGTTAPATTASPATTAPTTAPPTTATTAPPTTVRVEPEGPEDVKQIIRDVWPDDLEDRAIEIAFRESRFVPTAKNFCCYGIFQIYWEVHDVWLDDLGITSASQLYDPETNARAALALYERAGDWGPWGF